jgi:hypothetical protein
MLSTATLLMLSPALAAGSSCVGSWEVTGRAAVPGSVVECHDGDGTCDRDAVVNGACSFDVSVCVPDSLTCLGASGLTGLAALSRPRRAVSFGSGNCVASAVVAELRSRRGQVRSSKRLRLRALTDAGHTVDRLSVRCHPAITDMPGTPGPVGDPSCLDTPTCPANPLGSGQPSELLLQVAAEGSDVDHGSTGALHDLPVAGGPRLQLCLENCDASTDSLCDTRILTGPGTVNGTTLGLPVPSVLAGQPACIVEEYTEPVFTGGTADLATGAVYAPIRVRTKVFFSETCPPSEDPAALFETVVALRTDTVSLDPATCGPSAEAEATPLERTGTAEPPTPAWPDPAYPKSSDLVAVAVACASATGVESADHEIGLPGPSARVLAARACWLAPASSGPPPTIVY